MPAVISDRRRRSSGFPVLTLVLGVALAGCGYLLGGGEVPQRIRALFGADEGEAKASELPDGYVMVPMSGTKIGAYTKVAREHIFDVKNQRWSETPQPKKSLPDDVVLDRSEVLGRVLRADKPPGYVFRERDFLPEGTRPGLVGGIPAGKRGVRIELQKIPGLYGLNAGDRFDLVATFAPEKGVEKELSKVGGAFADAMVLDAKLNSTLKQAKVRVLVQSGVVVEPTTLREIPFQTSSLTQGMRVRTKPVQEVFVAVAPEEVALLEQALALDAQINCMPRSGQPEDAPDAKTPDLDVRSPLAGFQPGNKDESSGMRMVETLRDGKRELVPVPARKP